MKQHHSSMENFFRSRLQLPVSAWLVLQPLLVCKHFHKQDFIVMQDVPFQSEVFVVEGTIRAFTIDEAGHEKTTAFYQSLEFMSISTLRNQNGCSISTYQALSKTVVFFLHTASFISLLSSHPELRALVTYAKEFEKSRVRSRDECLMQVNGREKYRAFTLRYPTLEEKIPHYYIASYLGLTPVSLSRIRRASF